MARRKAGYTLPGKKQNSTQASTNLSSREYYEQRYNKVANNHEPLDLYAESTTSHINRLEKLWREYSKELHLDPYHELRKCQAVRIENFLHWMLNNYTVKKTSALVTYWHQLSQLYIRWKGHRVKPEVLKRVEAYIHGPLTHEHKLDELETEKPLLEVEDFILVLQCHWVTDTNVFPHERQRVQLATILLLAAFTGSRPQALLEIEYRDLDLFILHDAKTDKTHLMMQLQLTKTKSQKKRKRPKTYTFCLDENPMFCIISHIISLAQADGAFAVRDLAADAIFKLKVRPGLRCQKISWSQDWLRKRVLRASVQTKAGVRTSEAEGLTYNKYNDWVKRLGVATGFVQVMTTYCLRRATGNRINDDPHSNDAVRNLVMDHTGSMIFQRNYLSRMIRYDSQAAYMGNEHQTHLIRAASRMSRLIDPRRPKKLTAEQRKKVPCDQDIQDLYTRRDQLYGELRSAHQFIYQATGTPAYNEYDEIRKAIDKTIKLRERMLLKQIQAEYDIEAPVQDIQQQLSGEIEYFDEFASVTKAVQHAFKERSRIAKAFFESPAELKHGDKHARRVSIINDLVSLCSLRERRPPHKPRRQRVVNTLASHDQLDLESESSIREIDTYPIICDSLQCLFCLGDKGLSSKDRCQRYKSKFSMQRHVGKHLELYQPDESILCPHPRCHGILLNSAMHFKNHAARVHKIYM
ncbi:MAG: hypothetical protein M1814_005520 [Vezdaea aestivalis]|nr:MAG: hypothetical protein M1814_005520 [Vezdaea aestivalis]